MSTRLVRAAHAVRRRWLGATPAAVAALVLVTAVAFTGARWAVAADGDIDRFVLAGTQFTGPDAGVTALPGTGYDGQFSYRLARDPTELGRTAYGITLDAPLRVQRITYPALAFAFSFGKADWVPWALVLVNLTGLTVLALVSALLARDHGRPPAAGLLICGYFGLAISLGRDLTEITTVALLVTGVWALGRGHRVAASLVFCAAVLSRESTMAIYAALALGYVLAHRERRSLSSLLLLALPGAGFLGWQAYAFQTLGAVPLLSSGGRNLVLPFSDLVPAALQWVGGAAQGDRQDLINLGQLLVLAALVGLAAVALRSSTADPGVKLAWVAAGLLVASLSEAVWVGPADFRTASELAALSAVLLIGSGLRLRGLGSALGAAGVATILFRVTSL